MAAGRIPFLEFYTETDGAFISSSATRLTSVQSSSAPVAHSFAVCQTALIHRLAYALETAEAAFRCGTFIEREWSLSEGLGIIGELYASLDTVRSPEASTHMEALCDTCLSALAEAYSGRQASLSSALAFVHAMRGPFVEVVEKPNLAA